MKKIVVFGSINTDLVISSNRIPENGETIKGSNFQVNQGGKGANQAVAACLLGADVEMIGCVGNDAFGLESIKSLNNYGVKTDYVKIINDIPSGIAVIIKVMITAGRSNIVPVDISCPVAGL
jgi:ribokinase